MRVLLLAGLAVTLLAAPAEARKKKPKPGLKVHGFSVNTAYVPKGTTVEAEESTNTCYRIGGPSGAPDSLTATAYVKAVKIPKDAVTHLEFHVPWDDVTPEETVFDGPFKSALFRSRSNNTGGVYGGPTGRHDHFRYRMLPTGTPTSYYLAGDYTLKVTAKVGAKTYTAKGRITLNCA